MSPDLYLTLLILTLTGFAAYLMPSTSGQMKSTLIVIQVVVTFSLSGSWPLVWDFIGHHQVWSDFSDLVASSSL